MGKNRTNFQIRVITAIVFGLVVISSILFHPFSFGILFILINGFCQFEFYRLLNSAGKGAQWFNGILTGSFLMVTTFMVLMEWVPQNFMLFNLLFLIMIFIYELYRKSNTPFENIGDTLISLFYISLPLACFIALGFIVSNSFNPHLPLGFLILLWCNDSGAYITGISLGKNKLLERISPKKTWEGFIGGIALALFASFILSNYYLELSLPSWMVISLLVSVLGTFGDLVESMFKRSINIKDSGKLLPGHGGFLDRFDGLFLSAPAVYLFIKLFAKA